MKAGAVTVAQ
jgi:hypothetical protein